ncbi:MAG TPA: ATP-binding protein [Puia sp.]|jgi:AAA15 family ATPase/GTPase|nr:ATP-binding protein [Puia sp.]
MLVNFSIGNYLSFKEIQKLNLVPDVIKDLKENLHIPYFYDPEMRLLKSCALYGHNSHGKSNFIKGFQFFQHFIFTSFSHGQGMNTITREPFRLNPSMADKPSFFEITFLLKQTKYRYVFALTSEEIIEEGLYYAEAKIRENYLFERKGQDFKISKAWNKETENQAEHALSFAKPHILLLSVLLSQKNVPKIQDISNWLSGNLVIPDDYLTEIVKAKNIYSDLTYKNLILKFIKNADLGFRTVFDKVDSLSKNHQHFDKGIFNIWFDKEIKNFQLYTGHDLYNNDKKIVGNVEFELQKNESAGSIKYFILVSLLSYAIKNSLLIWVDELDARFHSSLLEMLVQSFHNPEINPINSQMIFTTHNTVLLDKKLRRDQMVVIEKNQFGESTIQRMHSSKKPIRIGKSMEKEYRKGNLGGVSRDLLNPTLFD